MKKRKEDKVIEHASNTLEDFELLYSDDGIVVQEYTTLLKEYKKLYNKFNKTMHLSGTYERSIIDDNDQLKENIDYAIKVGREKLEYNINEHKKTKKTFQEKAQKDKETIEQLKQQLNESNIKPIDENKTNNKRDDVIFYQSLELQNKDINQFDLKGLSFKEYVERELNSSLKSGENLVLAKLTIDKFSVLLTESKSKNINIINILRGLNRFFQTILKDDSVVYYFEDNIYYILIKNLTLDKSKQKLNSLNIKKSLLGLSITFSIGATLYTKEDTYNSINKKVDTALAEAEKSFDSSSIIFDF